MANEKYKVPAILYESENTPLPYIEVEEGDEMPPSLFIQEYKHTGEVEPDAEGNEQPIIDMYVHMYVDMQTLQSKLSTSDYDKVRVALGLMPLEQAKKEGQKVLDKVYNNVNNQVAKAQEEKGAVKEDLAKEFNKKLSEKFYNKAQDESSAEDENNNQNIRIGITYEEDKEGEQ